MIAVYIKSAWRNIQKNKFFSLINVLGLSIGLSSAFAIGAIILHDLSFDRFHKDRDRIYRITSKFYQSDMYFTNSGVAVPLAEYARNGITGLDEVALFFTHRFQKIDVTFNSTAYHDLNDVIIADKAYFDVFTYDCIAGNTERLNEPNGVILTKSRANKYFPNINLDQVLGKTLTYNDEITAEVIGIVNDIDKNTDLYFNEFLSLQSTKNTSLESKTFGTDWNGVDSDTELFVKLTSGVNYDHVQKQLNRVAKEHVPEEFYSKGRRDYFPMQPLSDLHFNRILGVFNDSEYVANKKLLKGMFLSALCLLMLGCINFINLNTAMANQYAKAIGIRKTIGSSKRQLFYQYLVETFVLCILATILSFFISNGLLQIFSDFIPAGVNLLQWRKPMFFVGFVSIVIIVTLLSGFYPAFFLSRLQTINVLKGEIIKGADKSLLRKYLTVFQFGTAQIFIISTLMIAKQMHFVLNKDMGFETQTTISLGAWQNNDIGKMNVLSKRLSLLPAVDEISLGGDPPASRKTTSRTVSYVKDSAQQSVNLYLLFGDLEYINVYNIELLAGRDRLNETIDEYVINETYSKMLGFSDVNDAIGKTFISGNRPAHIVGVMSDFHQSSLRWEVRPMALVGDKSRREDFTRFKSLHLRLHEQAFVNISGVLEEIESEWNSVFPEVDFEPHFQDETIQGFYQQERRTSFLMKWATMLAVIISCLGLFGLVIHSTARRVKEIGIRKVLGASLLQLYRLLCREQLVLVVVSFALAVPIAWWWSNDWLKKFAFKTNASWWVFVIGGFMMLVVSLFVISVKTIATARANPVESLRSE